MSYNPSCSLGCDFEPWSPDSSAFSLSVLFARPCSVSPLARRGCFRGDRSKRNSFSFSCPCVPQKSVWMYVYLFPLKKGRKQPDSSSSSSPAGAQLLGKWRSDITKALLPFSLFICIVLGLVSMSLKDCLVKKFWMCFCLVCLTRSTCWTVRFSPLSHQVVSRICWGPCSLASFLLGKLQNPWCPPLVPADQCTALTDPISSLQCLATPPHHILALLWRPKTDWTIGLALLLFLQ